MKWGEKGNERIDGERERQENADGDYENGSKAGSTTSTLNASKGALLDLRRNRQYHSNN